MTPSAVAYLRVSSREQLKNLSIPVQDAACRGYCEKHGLRLLSVFVEEGESAKTTDRTALKELLLYCRRNRGLFQYVVVYSIDRFARDLHDHAVLRRLLASFGISLRSVTQPIDESSTGKLLEGVLATFAEFDNAQKREKVIAGMKAAAERGQWSWKAPIGYLQLKVGGKRSTLAIDPDRGPLVQKGFELYASGLYDRNSVLAMLNELGLRTVKGKPLTPQTFEKTLRNPVYLSRLRLPGWQIEAAGNWPPLVDQQTWARVQLLLAGRAVAIVAKKRNHPDFPLRGFIRCAACGRPLTGSWSRGRSKKYAYYKCPAPRCGAIQIRKLDLERKFLDILDDLKPRREYLELFSAIVLDVWRQRQQHVADRRAALECRVREIKERKLRLNEVFIFEKAIDQETYHEELGRLNEALALAEIDLHDQQLEELDVEAVLEFGQHLVLNASRMWLAAPLDQRQRLQQAIFPDGLTYDGRTIGTGTTSSIFNEIRAIQAPSGRLVSPTGFEPVLPP